MKLLILSLVSVLTISTNAVAMDGQTKSYNEIVNDLESKVSERNTRTEYKINNPSILNQADIHAGVGVVSSRVKVDTGTSKGSSAMNGFYGYVGIDVFNPHWITELSFGSYEDDTFAGGQVSLSELDAKLYYTFALRPKIDLHLGGGLSTRFLSFNSETNGSQKDTSASSLIYIGGNYFLSKSASIRLETNYKKPMNKTTFDREAVSMGLSLSSFF